MRIFIGIKVEAPNELSLINKETIYEHSRWVKNSNFHLTLVFIGQADKLEIEKISNALSEIAKNHQKFIFKITGTGTFQKRRSSGVLWLGVENSIPLNELQYEVNETVYELMPNLKRQHHSYTPHITVARFKNKQELHKYKLILKNTPIYQEQHVSEIILYESISTPEGVEYKVLEKFTLESE